MIGYILVLIALVALTQAKAIVTNHCPHKVYIWSVPQVLYASTVNVPLKPYGQYHEPWRYGTTEMPGVAIKISPLANGLSKFADELDFAYSIDPTDTSKVWVDLSTVRGVPFKNNFTFHTCDAQDRPSDHHTHECDVTDNIELVLCGTSRTTPTEDTTSLEQIQTCYDSHCLAEITYPVRRAARMLSQAPRGASGTPIALSESSVSLCEIMAKFHPGSGHCDEETMRIYARDLYPEICNAEHGPLLMGAACEDVRDELRRAYPEVASKASGPPYQRRSDCKCKDTCSLCGSVEGVCICADAAISQAPHDPTTSEGLQASSRAAKRLCLMDACEPQVPGIECDNLYYAAQALFDLFGQDIDDYVARDECATDRPACALAGACGLCSALCE
jgi:hypothetical protein